MIKRRTALQAVLALCTIRPADARPVTTASPQSVTSWRVVVWRNGVHFGIPTDSGQLVISHIHSEPLTVLNLPRAVPGVVGWVPATAPSQPYITPEARFGDVVQPAAPDEIAAVGWDGFRFVIAINTPDALPIARMPYFLVRVEPGSYAMQTYAMPPAAHSEPVAIFVRGSSIILADHEGAEIVVPR